MCNGRRQVEVRVSVLDHIARSDEIEIGGELRLGHQSSGRARAFMIEKFSCPDRQQWNLGVWELQREQHRA